MSFTLLAIRDRSEIGPELRPMQLVSAWRPEIVQLSRAFKPLRNTYRSPTEYAAFLELRTSCMALSIASCLL